jgi:Ser/Thr protein kinase RdoA (MazF antagonist)
LSALSRTAELVLISPQGEILCCLPPIEVTTPWWQDIEPVVRAIRERDGIEVTVLRLLAAERDQPPGGCVTYLAEVARPVAALPWAGVLSEEPRRLSFAKPGGPTADLAWADSALKRLALRRIGPAIQIRSWNLSSLWRLPVEGQICWLKVVPPFLAHEGAVLAHLAGGPVPKLLGREGPKMLLAEIPGEDLYDADESQLLAMLRLLIGLQRSQLGQTERLRALGLPDWRATPLMASIADVVERTADELEAETRRGLEAFVRSLPRRFADLAACGLADTLVHGDFHPGNFRGRDGIVTLLDWGDSGIGHPLLDQAAFLDRVPVDLREAISAQWAELWRRAAPGSDPARAAALLAPLAAARQAVVYRRFLDNIEPAEQAYHRSDPAVWLQRTVELL